MIIICFYLQLRSPIFIKHNLKKSVKTVIVLLTIRLSGMMGVKEINIVIYFNERRTGRELDLQK